MLDVTTEGHIAILTINRPEAKNAVSPEVSAAIEAAVDNFEEDDDLWVGILSHAGDVFSAGADLKAINEGRAAEIQTQRGGFGGFVHRDRNKPVIAAVDGAALAGGCELVLACDVVVASKRARFGLPEVKRCLVAAAGGLFRLPRAIPEKIAMEMILTGDPIDAERAHHFGLVNRLTEPGEALTEAKRLAEQICANAPVAVRESRRVAKLAFLEEDAELWKMSATAIMTALSSEDSREGLMAFIEKRPPEWKGR